MFRRMIASLVLILGGTLLAPAAASAAPSSAVESRSAYYFGAISLSVADGAYGYSYDYPTRAGAQRRAHRGCTNKSRYPGYCRKVVWVRNGCAAVVVKWNANGSIRRYNWGVAYTRKRAVKLAHRNMPAGSRMRVAVCTTR